MDATAPDRDPATRLRLSPLFDADFYIAALAQRGIALQGAEPAEHYIAEGEAAGVAPHLLFDPHDYGLRNPDVLGAGANLLLHYIEHGAYEGRDPHPLVDLALLQSQLPAGFAGDPLLAYLQSTRDELKPHALIDPAHLARQQTDDRPSLVFYLQSDADAVNPSTEFDGRAYRRLYPQSGRMNPLVHFAKVGRALGGEAIRERGRLFAVLPDIEAAARLEPDIIKPLADLLAVPLLRGYDLARREFRLYRALAKATGPRPHAHVILTPWLKRGGADRAVIALARALLAEDEQARVLIVCTQGDEVEALDWAPITQRLSVARMAGEIDDSHDSCVAFCNFLRARGCRHLHVVNSRFGWDLIERYGAALRPEMRLYGFAFCGDFDEAGRPAGYAWTRLGRAIDNLDAVVSDNSRTIHDFAADHAFDADDLAKFFLLPLPVDERLAGAAGPSGHGLRRPRALWAGRFCTQKGLAYLGEVAKLTPELDVFAYGGEGAPAPVISGGGFADFADLPLVESSLFLHTAAWEGLPNVLLEAGAAGLPIVARVVGGIGDLVDETTGWPVAGEAPEAFAEAVRDALARPDEAEARARAMSARIAERHSWDAFAGAVRRLTGSGA